LHNKEAALLPLNAFLNIARSPSDRRPTTRECVHLVTRGHFRSLDKDGGHTIRSVVAENTLILAKLMALSVIGPTLRVIEVLHCGKRNFLLFCSCDLDTMPLYTNVTRIPPRYTGCANMNFLSQGFRKLSSHKHSRNYIPRRFAGGQNAQKCVFGWGLPQTRCGNLQRTQIP